MTETDHAAWVYRRGKPTWMFLPDRVVHALIHTTRRGTKYVIVPGLASGNPFWIARIITEKSSVGGSRVFSTVNATRAIRAYEIEFANGGRYLFPE